MIVLTEGEISALMFGIWRESKNLPNLVVAGEYISNEISKVKKLNKVCTCSKPMPDMLNEKYCEKCALPINILKNDNTRTD